MRQGHSFASVDFCVGIHPEECVIDEELRQTGGFAKFDMDDGYAVGPADDVFRAVQQFGDAVRRLGLELQLAKCQCYSPQTSLVSHMARPDVMPLGEIQLSDGSSAAGIKVGGVPIGEAVYIQTYLDNKATDMLSTVTTITNKLRDRLLQSW